jgi:hypothetical protein
MKAGDIIYMGLMIVIALVGLALAAKAHDSTIHVAGLLIFGFGVLQNFLMIARMTRH